MEDTAAALLARFSGGSSINDRWVAARELMAARQLVSVAETDKFQSAFQSIGDEARYGSDIERLVAVDLVVRLSNYVKKLAPVAKDICNYSPPVRHSCEGRNPVNNIVASGDTL